MHVTLYCDYAHEYTLRYTYIVILVHVMFIYHEKFGYLYSRRTLVLLGVKML